jgi:hypothetical protein
LSSMTRSFSTSTQGRRYGKLLQVLIAKRPDLRKNSHAGRQSGSLERDTIYRNAGRRRSLRVCSPLKDTHLWPKLTDRICMSWSGIPHYR